MSEGDEQQPAEQPTVIGSLEAAPMALSASSVVSNLSGGSGAFEYADVDALKILLQASAAAESLQVRFAELHQRRAELLSDQRQLEAERSAFEQRASEFAAEVARARAEHREQSAELEQRL